MWRKKEETGIGEAMRTIVLVTVLLFVVGAAGTQAQADEISYLLTLTNTPGVPAASGTFATVTLSTTTLASNKQAVKFSVTSITDWVIDRLFFNARDTGTGALLGLRLVSVDGSLVLGDPSKKTFDTADGNADGFGDFDYEFRPGQQQLKQTFTFTVVGNAGSGDFDLVLANFNFHSNGSAGLGNQFMAAHIKCDPGGSLNCDSLSPSSAFIATPEPGTMILLGSGLAGLGLLRRRRRRNS